MKTILVSLDQHSYSQAVLEIALILGRSFESYIEDFARGPDLHNLIAVEVPLAVPLSAEVSPQQMVESAHQQFETFMRTQAVSEAVGEPNGLSLGWFGNALQEASFLGDYGRAFNIVVVGRPDVVQNAAGIADHETSNLSRSHAAVASLEQGKSQELFGILQDLGRRRLCDPQLLGCLPQVF